MIWSLNDAESIEYAPESTIRAFDPACDVPGQTQFQLSKFVLFAAPQRAAVVRFLRAFLPDPDLGPITGDASTMFAIARTGVSARSKPTPA